MPALAVLMVLPHGDSSLHAALTSIGVSPSVASLLSGGSGIVNLTAAQASGTNGDNHDDDDHDDDNSSSGKRNNLHTERNRHSILGRIICKQKFHRTYPSLSSSPSPIAPHGRELPTGFTV